MKRSSLQFRLTTWFTLSLLAVSLLFAGITYFHLRHELRFEQWQRVHPENPDFVLHGTYSAKEIDDIAGHILHISLFFSLPFAALAIALGWYLARKSLRPVTSINRQLQQIQAANLDERLRTPDADSELETITRNINALLERLEAAYRDVAEFSARVAHELRTPLTLMRLQLEDSSANIEPTLAENLQDELQRLEGYVNQCLLIAQAERGRLDTTSEQVALPVLIEDVLEPFSLLAKEDHRQLYFEYEAALQVETVPWILRQLLHNLLSNALKHGEGPISVLLETPEGTPRLSIINPIKKELTSGTGIGLRIVNALTRAQTSLRVDSFTLHNTYHAQVYFDKARNYGVN